MEEKDGWLLTQLGQIGMLYKSVPENCFLSDGNELSDTLWQKGQKR